MASRARKRLRSSESSRDEEEDVLAIDDGSQDQDDDESRRILDRVERAVSEDVQGEGQGERRRKSGLPSEEREWSRWQNSEVGSQQDAWRDRKSERATSATSVPRRSRRSKSRDADARRGRCSVCGSSEHYARDCTSRRGSGRDDNACFYCGEPGHFKISCPVRQLDSANAKIRPLPAKSRSRSPRPRARSPVPARSQRSPARSSQHRERERVRDRESDSRRRSTRRSRSPPLEYVPGPRSGTGRRAREPVMDRPSVPPPMPVVRGYPYMYPYGGPRWVDWRMSHFVVPEEWRRDGGERDRRD